MADYVSKYTGSEVDGILDDAIELPQATSNDNGKFLKYDSGSIIWDSLPEGLPTHHNSTYNSSILTVNNYGDVEWYRSWPDASDGQYLKYSNNTGIIWDDPIDISSAFNGEVLKYSSNTGIMWGDPIDSSDANDGEFLKYSGDSGFVWSDPLDTSGAEDGDFLKYSSNAGIYWDNPLDTSGVSDGQYLKYSSNTGIIWDDPIDTSDANNGEVLKYSSVDGFYWDTPIDTSEADDGEYLKYSSDTGIMWGPVAGTLPEYNGEETVLLTMESGIPNWNTVEGLNIIPYYNSSYAGAVLTVLDNGALGWVSPNQ